MLQRLKFSCFNTVPETETNQQTDRWRVELLIYYTIIVPSITSCRYATEIVWYFSVSYWLWFHTVCSVNADVAPVAVPLQGFQCIRARTSRIVSGWWTAAGRIVRSEQRWWMQTLHAVTRSSRSIWSVVKLVTMVKNISEPRNLILSTWPAVSDRQKLVGKRFLINYTNIVFYIVLSGTLNFTQQPSSSI